MIYFANIARNLVISKKTIINLSVTLHILSSTSRGKGILGVISLMQQLNRTSTGGTINEIVTNQGFTDEQCEKLIQMFRSVQTGSTTTTSEPSANMAGMHYGFHVFTLTSFFSEITTIFGS